MIFFVLPVKTFGQTEKECDVLIDSAIKKMFRKQHVESLEGLIQARSVAHKKKYVDQYFRSTNNIGLNYFLMSDFEEALKYYMEAYEIAAGMPEKNRTMTVLNNIAALYFHEKNHQKAYEYFLKAYKTAKQNKIKGKTGAYAVNLALVLNKLNKPDEAYRYILEAETLTKNQTDVNIMNKLALAENLYLKNKYSQSESIIDPLIRRLPSIDQSENTAFLLYLKAQIHEKRGNYEGAKTTAKQILKLSPSIYNREDIYKYLSKINAVTKDYEEALKYKDSVIIVSDSIFKINNSALFNTGKIKFEMRNYQFEIEQGQQRMHEERKKYYIIITATVIIIILTLLFLFANATKYKQQKKIAELEYEKKQSDNLILRQQLAEQESFSLLEKERLKNEIEQQNRQLTSQALILSSRNEVIEEIIEAIINQPEVSENITLVKSIKDLKFQLKNNNQWDSFFKHFEGVNQNFIALLKQKHPDLASSEIRFICYVYMNLTHKEMASILNISPESCRKRKERISKKLNLSDKMNLYDYISALR